jgi:predicted DsbA family dithiol-disulfide isomerase
METALNAAQRIQILYFSDALCVWAYFAELRLAEVARNFGAQVELDFRLCSVFGNTAHKIANAWSTKGGYDGFADHLHHTALQFPERPLHPELWRKVRPASSLSPHLYIKAVQLTEREGAVAPGTSAAALRKMREAFSAEGLDIARVDVQEEIGRQAGADIDRARQCLADGRAHALLNCDYMEAESLGVKGSPTMILSQGRQTLYGNVGYRIIEANIQELLREPSRDQTSWC